MTARVSPSQVKQIVNTNLSDAVILASMIDTAHAVVDETLLTAGLSTHILDKIELYLAAHFIALTEEGGAITRDKLGDADQSFANVYDKGGLNLTRFGQTALALDSSGQLAQAAQTQLKAAFRVV